MNQAREQGRRRDRWMSWIVVGVFLVALILGWGVKTAAEGQSKSFAAEGISGKYPEGWTLAEVEEPVLFQAEELWAQPYRSTLTLQRRPLPGGMSDPLRVVQQSLVLERGRGWTAYRVLETETEVSFEGRTGLMRVSFAYVETNPNPFLETVPVVVEGEDYFFVSQDGNSVYIVTFTAAEQNYDREQRVLQAFMRALQD